MTTEVVDIAAWWILVPLLILITVADWQNRRIPNVLNFALFLSGLTAAALLPEPGLPSAAVGAAIGFGLPLAVAEAYRRFRGVDGLGLGDVKFLAGAGAWTGWQGIGPTICLAAVTALLFLAARRLAGARFDRNEAHPFGPHLCIALLIVRAFQPSVS